LRLTDCITGLAQAPDEKVNLPHVVFLPMNAVKVLKLNKQSRIPFECRKAFNMYIASSTLSVTEGDWTMLFDWLTAAGHEHAKEKHSMLIINEHLMLLNKLPISI
jgi:hypothetical protein